MADGDRGARSLILDLASSSDRREREGRGDDTNHSAAGAAGDASAAGAQAGAPAAPATVSHFFATV